MATTTKTEVVRTVPRGYPEPGYDETYPDPVVDEETGELVGHAFVESELPATAQETNAE